MRSGRPIARWNSGTPGAKLCSARSGHFRCSLCQFQVLRPLRMSEMVKFGRAAPQAWTLAWPPIAVIRANADDGSLGPSSAGMRRPADGSLSPGRRGRYHPRPPQTRTCAIHAFGSSRESFADDVMDAFGAILCHRHSLTEGIHAISSVWLSMSYRGQGLPGACPVPCFPTWSSPRDASLPSFGSQRAWFPALAGTMKALRLPTCASAVD